MCNGFWHVNDLPKGISNVFRMQKRSSKLQSYILFQGHLNI
jgi:hypothetical protein